MIEFSPYNRFQFMKLTEGEHLMLLRRGKMIPCQFVKVTRKGFNLLNLMNNTYILRRHAYMTGMGGKDYSIYTPRPFKGEFLLPEHVHCKLSRTGRIEPRDITVRSYFNPIFDTLETI